MRQILKHPMVKHPLVFVSVFLLIAIFVFIPIAVSANMANTTPTMNEYTIPIAHSQPDAIAEGSDGNMWFVDASNNAVFKITPTGSFTEYNIPLSVVSNPMPDGITAGPDGNIWFSEGGNAIGKITTTGQITQYPVPTSLSNPNSIVIGPDGNLWFTAGSTNAVGVMNLSGTLLHTYSSTGYGPYGISVGPDGNIWYSIQNSDEIAKMNLTNGAVTTYAVSVPSGGWPESTHAGPDGNEWFTTQGGSVIGYINPQSGSVKEFTGSTSTSEPAAITAGPDGNMWFSEQDYGIATVNVCTGSITQYPTTHGAYGIAIGPNNNVWYSVTSFDSQIPKIGYADFGLSVSPACNSSTSEGSSSGSTSSESGSSAGSSSGSGSSTGGGVSTGGGTSVPGDRVCTDCPNITSCIYSASECSALAPGQNESINAMPPGRIVSTTTLLDGIVLANLTNGTTTATVSASLNLMNINYEVPSNQILYVDGKLGDTTVAKGGTIKGNGEVGNLAIAKGAYLSPGHSPGCIKSNNLSLFGTYNVQIGGAAPCTSYDQTIVKESVMLSGELNVSIADGFKPKPGQTFTIIKNEGNKPIDGTFADLSQDSIILADGTPFKITYSGNGNNDVLLTALDDSVYSKVLSTTNTSESSLTAYIRKYSKAIVSVLSVALGVTLAALFVLYNRFENMHKPKAESETPNVHDSHASKLKGL